MLQALKSQVKEQLDELPSEENLHLMVDNLTAQVPGLEYLGDTIKEGLAILPDKDEVNNDEKQIDESCNAHLVYFVHHTDYEMRPSCSSFMFLKLGVENIFEIIQIILKMKFISLGCRRSGRCLRAYPSS